MCVSVDLRFFFTFDAECLSGQITAAKCQRDLAEDAFENSQLSLRRNEQSDERVSV